MMLSLGLFVFMRQTTPYQNMNRNIDYRWPTNNRIGLRPAAQFLGVDSEKITLSGVLLPELTGRKTFAIGAGINGRTRQSMAAD